MLSFEGESHPGHSQAKEVQPEAHRHLSPGQFAERLLALTYTGTHVPHSGTQGPSWVMARPPTF